MFRFRMGLKQRYRKSHRSLGGKHPLVGASKARGAFKPIIKGQTQTQAPPQILNESY